MPPGAFLFQHSLMNLGVETVVCFGKQQSITHVSAFSDESWGGDHREICACRWKRLLFQHSLMNLGVETHPDT